METHTPGSASGPGKRTGSNPDTAPWADSTGSGCCAVRGREVAGAGFGKVAASVPDDARHAGETDTRLRPHGTTSLFAAFNVADGTVISSLHRRHRTIEFKKFLIKIDEQVPAGLEIHLVCDNYGTHKTPAIKAWLANHPRVHMHLAPTYSSWINQVERFFAYVTADLLQRSHHNTVAQLEADLRRWVKDWNTHPKPFIWTKTADEILTSLARLLQRITGAGH